MAMSEAHKQALAEGRRRGHAVRAYLDFLDREKKRGPKVAREDLQDRVDELAAQADAEPDPVARLELVQRRLDAETELANRRDEESLEDLVAAFVEVAKEYSDRKGITYTAWRELGVPAAVLRDAGVPRTRRPSP